MTSIAQQSSRTSPNRVYRKPRRVMKSFLLALAITLSFFCAAYAFDVEYCVRESKPRHDTQTLSRPYMSGVHLTDIAEQPGPMLRHQRPGDRIRVQRRPARVRGPHSAGRHHHRECGLRDIPVSRNPISITAKNQHSNVTYCQGCGVHQYELELGNQPGVVQPRECMD
ncbi:hypothetical protein DFH09DRAFT_481639 [Mycena vulgaris]|nr:hypothetical protein DFH09DRAFT_481639 [Mycena vulgaris]